MKKPVDQSLVDTLAKIIDAESKEGIAWWPGEEMAPIAVRRWISFKRRHKSKHPETADRVHDLAKGLQAHFEPDIPYTHRLEWMHLAELLAVALHESND